MTETKKKTKRATKSVRRPTAPVTAPSLADLLGAKRPKSRAAPDPAMTSLRKQVGASSAPDVVAFVDLCATHAVRSRGLWQIAKPKEMLATPPSKAPWDAPSRVAHATSTLYLGKDGGGLRFFVVRHKTLSEVWVHDPGAGQFAFLASSLTAFVALDALVARWDAACEAHDVDPDPDAIDEGDVDFSAPPFAELRAHARALRGQVNLVTGTDYDETVCALAGSTLRAKSASDAATRFKRWKHAQTSPQPSAQRAR